MSSYLYTTPAEIDAYLSQFDVWDRYDFDGDGDFNEADGYIDHFQAVHAGEGEEAGADADAIWSHRWYAQVQAGGPNGLPGTPIGDTFIVTDTYIAGAGRVVNFVNIESIEVDGGGGFEMWISPRAAGFPPSQCCSNVASKVCT